MAGTEEEKRTEVGLVRRTETDTVHQVGHPLNKICSLSVWGEKAPRHFIWGRAQLLVFYHHLLTLSCFVWFTQRTGIEFGVPENCCLHPSLFGAKIFDGNCAAFEAEFL